MSVLVTDAGFAPEDFAQPVLPLADAPLDAEAVEVPGHADPAALALRLPALRLIRVAFAAMGDGRGFTLARRLRLMGYARRLRAAGPLVADQYPLARRAGFDEVEIPDALAARQPAAQWLAAAAAQPHDYRSRLAGVPAAPRGV